MMGQKLFPVGDVSLFMSDYYMSEIISQVYRSKVATLSPAFSTSAAAQIDVLYLRPIHETHTVGLLMFLVFLFAIFVLIEVTRKRD